MKLFILLLLSIIFHISFQLTIKTTFGREQVGCEDAETLIKGLEKLNLCAFKRYSTPDLFICYGYNLSFPRAKTEIEQVGGDWNNITSQLQCLNSMQCASLFNATLRIASQLASYAFGNRVCPCEFAILVDAVYSIGPTISSFVKLKNAVQYNQWPTAVKEMENSDWCKINQERCSRDTVLMLRGCNGK